MYGGECVECSHLSQVMIQSNLLVNALWNLGFVTLSIFFYVRVSVHRESMSIIVQQGATIHGLRHLL